MKYKFEIGKIINDVEIIAKGVKGDGIAKIDNFVILIKDVEIGDVVNIKIINMTKRYGFGEVI